MAVQMRDPVTTTTPCSAYVQQGAVRLFVGGFLPQLHYLDSEDGHLSYSLPSESTPGTLYQIDYLPAAGTIRCSCPAGQHNVPCKHVELFRLSRGMVQEVRG